MKSAFIGAVAVSMFAAQVGCDRDTTGDDWGPRAGWARAEGVVRNADGTPRPNATVSIGQCEAAGGFAGESKTDSRGRYTAWASLPPVGFYHLPETGELVSKCVVRARWVELRASAEVELTFVAQKSQAVAIVVDLTF